MLQVIYPMVMEVLVALIALWLGVRLVRRGKQRRIGTEPHCPRCNYNLTGGFSDCPECGLVSTTVARGERVPSWPKIVGGVLLVLFSLGLLVNSGDRFLNEASRGRLYYLRPDFVVLWDLHDKNLHPRAADELRQRLAAGGLSASSINAATDGTIYWLNRWRQGGTIYYEVLGLAHDLLTQPQVSRIRKVQLLSGLDLVTCSYQSGPNSIELGGDTMIHGSNNRPDFLGRYHLDLLAVDGKPVIKPTSLDRFIVFRNRGSLSWGSLSWRLAAHASRRIRLRLTVDWYDLWKYKQAAAALKGLPPHHPLVVSYAKGIHTLQQILQLFQMKPLGSVQCTLTLSSAKGWRATADASNWKIVTP